MRCTVCGKQERYHKPATFHLQYRTPGGRWETRTTANATKCQLILHWQSALLKGSLEGHGARIQRAN